MGLELSSDFEVVDPRFRELAFLYVRVEKLWTGCRWAEGPAWFGGGRYLVWSDIPNDRVLRWDETATPSRSASPDSAKRRPRLRWESASASNSIFRWKSARSMNR